MDFYFPHEWWIKKIYLEIDYKPSETYWEWLFSELRSKEFSKNSRNQKDLRLEIVGQFFILQVSILRITSLLKL